MARTSLALLAVTALTLVACGGTPPQAVTTDSSSAPPADTMSAPTQDSSLPSSLAPGKTGYVSYRPGVIGDGQKALVFFYAKWDPFSKANDASLQQWYAAQQFPVSTYRVDYDVQTDLKNRYGITQQNTFVLVDGNGNALKVISFPSETDLKGLLQG